MFTLSIWPLVSVSPFCGTYQKQSTDLLYFTRERSLLASEIARKESMEFTLCSFLLCVCAPESLLLEKLEWELNRSKLWWVCTKDEIEVVPNWNYIEYCLQIYPSPFIILIFCSFFFPNCELLWWSDLARERRTWLHRLKNDPKVISAIKIWGITGLSMRLFGRIKKINVFLGLRLRI